MSKIPFTAGRSEIIALLGRNSRILNDADEPVHIIMERVSSKTYDAFVEFMTLEDAMRAVDRHTTNVAKSRPTRLGDRPISIELVSQADLLRQIFPLARGINWEDPTPRLSEPHTHEPWEFFKGFVSEEEMTMLAKNAEVPHRSPFSRDCPQRPYECLISTLKKYPWYLSYLITNRERYIIFRTTLALVRNLKNLVDANRHERLDKFLLKRLVNAAMRCPGFTVLQKDDIAYYTDLDEVRLREFDQPRFANSWRHIYALTPKPGVPADLLEVSYLACLLLSAATSSNTAAVVHCHHP